MNTTKSKSKKTKTSKTSSNNKCGKFSTVFYVIDYFKLNLFNIRKLILSTIALTILYLLTDSSSSLDDSFSSDGQLHDRVKDIQIIPKSPSTKTSQKTSKMNEAELRKSIKEKLTSGRSKDDSEAIPGDNRPGVCTIQCILDFIDKKTFCIS